MSNAFTNSIKPRGNWLKFNQEVGQSYTIEVIGVSERQARDFETKEPKTFKDGNPIMEQVIEGLDYNAESEDEARAILLIDKAAQRQAIGRAIIEADASDLEAGGVLELTWTGYGVGKNAANPPKAFEAKYTAPEASGNTWGGDE